MNYLQNVNQIQEMDSSDENDARLSGKNSQNIDN